MKQAGLTISLDTNDDPDDRWGGVLEEVLGLIDVFLPSERELCRITGSGELDEALARLGKVVPTIVVKRGARGVVVQSGEKRQEIVGLRVTPVDTIGAGDSFNAGFLYAYLRGCSMADAAWVGNVTGALSTLSFGGTEAWRDAELRERFLSDNGVPELLAGDIRP